MRRLIVRGPGLRGPAGIDGTNGIDGLPGVNAVPADEAVAGYLSAPTSETTAALGVALARQIANDPDYDDIPYEATYGVAVQAATNATPAIVQSLVLPKGSRVIPFGDSTDAEGSTGWWQFYYLTVGRLALVVRNAGIGGNRTDQMLARLQTDVLAYSPDVVILGSITNDLGNSNIVSLAQSKANIIAMVNAIRATGATPILRTTLPVDNAGTTAPYNTVSGRRQGVLAYNTWLLSYAASKGLDVLDLYQAVADPLTGGYQAGITSDGIHPTETGGKAIADYLLSLPSPRALKGGFPFARAVTDATNLMLDGVFAVDANSNGLSDSWYTSGTATYSRAAAAAGVSGYWQRVTQAGTTGSFAQDVNTGWAVGDRLRVVGRYRTSSTGATNLVRLMFVGSSGAANRDLVPSATKEVTGLGGVFSCEAVVPASTTSVRILVQSQTTAGWIEVAEVAVRNLTALGL